MELCLTLCLGTSKRLHRGAGVFCDVTKHHHLLSTKTIHPEVRRSKVISEKHTYVTGGSTITFQGERVTVGSVFVTYKWGGVVRMGRLMYCCSKRRFMSQTGQVIWTLLDGTEVSETTEEKVMGTTMVASRKE